MATTAADLASNLTTVADRLGSQWCDPNITETPQAPVNLTVLGIFTTSAILQWAMSCDLLQTHHSWSFQVHVDPVSSDWMHDHDLVAFVVTRINGDTRQYKLKSLVPETVYTVYVAALNTMGTSNTSETVTFKTKEATVSSYPDIHVRPIEAVLVFCILSAWFITIAWFLKKWATLRILHPSEYRYTKTPPKNLENVKVVNTEDDSVIYRNYGKNYFRTMEARQKRLDRMQTMPNLNVAIADFPEATFPKLESKLSKSLEECASTAGYRNPSKNNDITLEICPEENSEQFHDLAARDVDNNVHSTTV